MKRSIGIDCKTRNIKNLYQQAIESKHGGTLPSNLNSTMYRLINLPYCDENGNPFCPVITLPPPEDITEEIVGEVEYKKIQELRRNAKKDIIKHMKKEVKAHGYSLQEHDCYSKHSYGKYSSDSIRHTISFRNIWDKFEIYLMYTIILDIEKIKNACLPEYYDELDLVSKKVINMYNSTTIYTYPYNFEKSILLNTEDEFNNLVNQIDSYLNNVAYPFFNIIENIHDVARCYNVIEEDVWGSSFFGHDYNEALFIAYYDIIEHRYPLASENFRKCYSEQKNKIARIDEMIQHPTFQNMVDNLEADKQDEYLTLRFYEILMNINNYKTE